MKRIKSLLALVLALAILVSGGVTSQKVYAKKSSNVSLDNVTINYTQYTLKKNKSLKLKVTAPKGASVTWKSSKPKVATITKKGKVKAKKNGKSTIFATVKYKGKKKTLKMRLIVGEPVQSIALPDQQVTINKGSTYTINPTIAPANASNKTCTYESANEAIATVDANGLVTAIAEGETSVTIKTTDGSNKQATLQVKVTNLVTKIEIVSKTGKFEVDNDWGGSLQLEAKIYPEDLQNKVKVTWSYEYENDYDQKEAIKYDDSYPTLVDGLLKIWCSYSKYIKVTATATDGSGVSDTKKITINHFIKEK